MTLETAMRVKDLIAELQKYPADTLVTTACYEFGFQPLTKVQPVKLRRLSDATCVSATHVFANWTECESEPKNQSEPVSALCLGDLEPGITEAQEQQELSSSV